MDTLRSAPASPEHAAPTRRFSDIYAERRQSETRPSNMDTEKSDDLMPGLPSSAKVENLPPRGGFVPVAMRQPSESESIGLPDMLLAAPIQPDQKVLDPVVVAQRVVQQHSAAAPRIENAGMSERVASVSPQLQGEGAATDQPHAESVSEPLSTLPGIPIRSPLTLQTNSANPAMGATDRQPVTTDVLAQQGAELTESESVQLREAELQVKESLKPAGNRIYSGVEIAAMTAVNPRQVAAGAPEIRPANLRTPAMSAAAPAAAKVDSARLDSMAEGGDGFMLTDMELEPNHVNAVMQAQATQRMQTSTGAVASMDGSVATVAMESSVRPNASLNASQEAGAVEGLDVPGEMAELSIETPVDDANWTEALNYRLQWLAQRGVQSARIQLNPAELGPMEVTVDVVDDVATVQFRADHGMTREALEQSSPRLRELMMQAGFERAEFDVTGGESEQRQRQSPLADSRSGDDARSQDWNTGDDDISVTADTPDPTLARDRPSSSGQSGLNLYV